MLQRLLTLLALTALALFAPAQTPIYVGGLMTDSSTTVNSPAKPAGAQNVTFTLNHRARFMAGSETNLIVYQGSGWCDYQLQSEISQSCSISTNGVTLGPTFRTKAPFTTFGTCIPFDGVYDWAGNSGWSSGYVWRPTTLVITIPVSQLGPTITVTTLGHMEVSTQISCYWTSTPSDLLGQVTWFTNSWWEGDLFVAFS